MKKQMMSLEISEDLLQKVKEEASIREMSASAFIRWLVKEFFRDKDEKKN